MDWTAIIFGAMALAFGGVLKGATGAGVERGGVVGGDREAAQEQHDSPI